jgi:AraC family transcriptional regulator of adaptative response / DNA-3-methyladenine glycosylase II
VFLVGDLGVRQGLVRAGLPDDSAAAAKVAEAWRPWRSYAQMHLWTSTTAEGMTGNNEKGIQHD